MNAKRAVVLPPGRRGYSTVERCTATAAVLLLNAARGRRPGRWIPCRPTYPRRIRWPSSAGSARAIDR